MLWIYISFLWLIGLVCVFALIDTANRADREAKDAFRDYMKRKALINELSGKRIPYED